MAQTKLMRADEIAYGFNSVDDRKYWKATLAGTRVNPEVNFNSRSSMVIITYRISHADFVVTFERANCAFGDFLASAYRSLEQIVAALKASGFAFEQPLEPHPVLRVEYDPHSKLAFVALARCGDAWQELAPLPVKNPPKRSAQENISAPVDLI